jgi:hypothetical protein
MKNVHKNLMICLSLLVAAACAEVGDTAQEEPAKASPAAVVEPAQLGVPQQQTPQPAVSLPQNVVVEGDWLFAMELTPENLDLTLHGTSLDRLSGKLADDEGRRTILYYGPDFRTPQTVFKADWYLPAVGARNSQGEMLVCVNRLVGAPSALTKGSMPDPSNGVDLVCRWHSARGWSREVRVPRTGAALWLSDVVALREGKFRIVYSDDGTGLMVDDPDEDRVDGTYRVEFDRGRLGQAELASRARRP